MELRLPDLASDPSGDLGSGGPLRPEQVVAALRHLVDGDVEFVGLEGDIAWIQTAEVPGGYVLERGFGGPVPEAQPAPLTADAVQSAFLAFLAGDVTCGLDWPEPPPAEPKKRRGFLRR